MWVKIDDAATQHVKLLDAGLEAIGLWLAGLCYANRTCSDGAIVKRHLGVVWGAIDRDRLDEIAERLVAVGLWDDCGDHYRIHDYEHYQGEAMRDARDAKRVAAAMRKRAQRTRETSRAGHGDVAHDVTPEVTHTSQRDMRRDTSVTYDVTDRVTSGVTCRVTDARDARSPAAVASHAPDRPADRPTDPTVSSLRSDRERARVLEGDEGITPQRIIEALSSARTEAGAAPLPDDPMVVRQRHASLLAAGAVLDAEAKRRGSNPLSLLQEAARGYCGDRWVRSIGMPLSEWLRDPARWLGSSSLRPHEPSPRSAFLETTEEELDALFGDGGEHAA